MLERLQPIQLDPILALIDQFRQDNRNDKIDLGVGVYKDHQGQTPIMQAVQTAEQHVITQQQTKAYVGMAGNIDFNRGMTELIFSSAVDHDRIAAVQAPGGCGALSILAATLKTARPDATLWLSDPTWGNHYAIFHNAGFQTQNYAYFDHATRRVDEAALLQNLKQRGPEDIVLLHGACHNPTGADISESLWDEIIACAAERGFLMFIDIAYQGLGQGLIDDTYCIRKMQKVLPEFVVAASCSKNFGLYRERVGCAFIAGQNTNTVANSKAHLFASARKQYSMPPNHGAAIVAQILGDATLKQQWQQELEQYRLRIKQLRSTLKQALRQASGNDQWDFIADHQGMFSLLSLPQQQTERLKQEFGIYCVPGGRINVAGFESDAQIEQFANALAQVNAS